MRPQVGSQLRHPRIWNVGVCMRKALTHASSHHKKKNASQ
jgi:hypothetical protein